jgi:hypothetical protein
VEKESHDSYSLKQAVCDIMATATYPGAQTERRGGAGPVRGLLGGKGLTGRFCFSSQESVWFRLVFSLVALGP